MENDEVDTLGPALRRAFERAADLQPRPEFVAGLARLRPAPSPSATRRSRAPRWLAVAATLALLTAGGYWTFEARLVADPLRDAVIGDHRYCALGLSTDGKEATGITSLDEFVNRSDPGFRALEQVPADQIPTPQGAAQVVNRHSCIFGGRRFAHLILQYRGTPVSLIVTRGSATTSALNATATHSMTTAHAKDLTIISARTTEYAVFFVGALPASELSPLADALSADVLRALAKS